MLSIRFESVSKRFDQVVAVDDFSLQINEGELFFLLGPSGSGKTTCLRMVAGFYQPDGGQLFFGDRVVNGVPPHRRNTGMVFQNYALWPHLTCRGNVEYGLKVRKVERRERDRRVDQALEMVRLNGLGDRYPNQLSGGQQQRVALARALVIEPDALLLDEPLSNLDAQLRLEMRNEIKRLHEQTKTTALYVTHDQEEALSIADRIAVMKDGRLQQVGTPRELYRAPATRFVAEFMGETNFLSGQIVSVDAQNVSVETAYGKLVAVKNAAQRDLTTGQQVWCSLRPESLRVQAGDGLAQGNILLGALQQIVYLGTIEQYRVQLNGNASDQRGLEALKVAVANPGVAPPPPGAALQLHIAADDIVVLAD